MIYIGIDPGVHTGFALYASALNEFSCVETMQIHRALVWLGNIRHEPIAVVMEDARQRKWFGNNSAQKDRARLQGAGSIKRDCQIIEDACKDWGIPITLVAPKNNLTKLSAAQFEKITGWKGRTSEHARDAAMLVFQYKPTKNNQL